MAGMPLPDAPFWIPSVNAHPLGREVGRLGARGSV